MKKMRIYLFLFLFILSLPACEKVNQLTIFNLDYNTQVIVQSLIGINLPFNILTPAIETNSNSEFEINDTRKDLIEEIQLTALSVSIHSPESGDFSFLSAIKIYIIGENLEEKLIAWNESVNSEETTLILETSTDDLQEYVKLDKISLKVNAVTKKLLLTDYTLDINSVFRIDAKILGI